jgi:hypothetical protein
MPLIMIIVVAVIIFIIIIIIRIITYPPAQVDGTDCRRFKLPQVLHCRPFPRQLLMRSQMQRLLLGPAGSTVELELRRASDKSSFSV